MSMPLYRMAKEIVLPKGEKAILTELCDHMNDNTGLCYPSRERLAKLTGYNVSSVTRLLKNLRNRGLISWTTVRRAGQFGFNNYKINRVALSHAAGVHVADNDNTELHSVPSPSGMVQRKPLVLTLDEPLVSDGLANEGDFGQLAVPASNDNTKSFSGPPKTPEQFWSLSRERRHLYAGTSQNTMRDLIAKGLKYDIHEDVP